MMNPILSQRPGISSVPEFGVSQSVLFEDPAPPPNDSGVGMPSPAPSSVDESVNSFVAKGARHLLHEYLGHDTGTGVPTSRLFDLLSEAGGSVEDRGHLYKIALGVTSVADRSSEMDVLGQQQEEYSRLVASKRRSQQYGHGGPWKALRRDETMASLFGRWRGGSNESQLSGPQMERLSNVLGALEVAYPTCTFDAAVTFATLLAPLSTLFVSELDLYFCVTGFVFLLCRDGFITIASLFPAGSDPMSLPARDRIAAFFGVQPLSRATLSTTDDAGTDEPYDESDESIGFCVVRDATTAAFEETARLRRICGSFVAHLHWFNPGLYSHMMSLQLQGGVCFEDWVPHTLRTLLVQQVCHFDQLLRLWDAYLKDGSLKLHPFVVIALLEERTWELTEGPWGDKGAHEAVLMGRRFGWGPESTFPTLLPSSTLRVDVPQVLQRAERLRERARHAGLVFN